MFLQIGENLIAKFAAGKSLHDHERLNQWVDEAEPIPLSRTSFLENRPPLRLTKFIEVLSETRDVVLLSSNFAHRLANILGCKEPKCILGCQRAGKQNVRK